MKQRVLVLGASGYVGRRVVAALAASDWAEPIAGVRHAGRMCAVREAVFDATDAIAVTRALSEADAAINCVAGAPETMIAGARALSVALTQPNRPTPRLVHFSSMAVYGPVLGTIHETQPLATGLGGYGDAKVEAERVLSALPSVVTLRPGCIYGPGSPQWSLRIASLLRAYRIGDLGAQGDGYSNLVYIDDVVQAALVGLTVVAPHGQAAIYNLSMADAPTWNGYFEAYAQVLGAVPLRRISGRRLKIETKILAPALKIMQMGLGGVGKRLPPPISPSLLRLWGQDIRLVSLRAQTELGLSWTPLAQGLTASLGA